MASATIVRVKRKITDDPVEALVLSFKRRRDETSADDDHTATEVFRFTGTAPAVEDQDQSESPTETREHLKRILTGGNVSFPNRVIRTGIRRSQKLHLADIRLKTKQEKEDTVRQQRDALLLSLRAIDMRDVADDETTADKSASITIHDQAYDTSVMPDLFEPESPTKAAQPKPSTSSITCNDQPLVRISSEQLKNDTANGETANGGDSYVFDYYVPSKFCDNHESENGDDDFAAGIGPRRTSTPPTSESENDVTDYFSNLIAVYPYNLCDEAIDNGATEGIYHADFDDESDDDDEDSNAESNWRNEYPDEDDDFEKRYDFYDQNYESADNEEDEFFEAEHTKHGESSMINDMRGLKLGAEDDEDDEDFSGGGQKNYFNADYDSDD